MRKIFVALTIAATISTAADAPGEIKTPAEWLETATLRWTPAYAIGGPRAETIDEHAARRKAIVSKVLEAASDPTMPALFSGPKAAAQSALFVLSVWNYESSFDVRVQSHHCEGLVKTACDSGSAYCLGQIHPKDVRELGERGWTGKDLEEDLGKCARATLWRLRAALLACKNEKLEGGDRFAHYATGKCEPSAAMRLRYQTAESWAKAHPVP